MPGEQDIVSLGLNIDSFNSQKMKTLREYISIFNDLSKYDGKIFNPVMGDGLASFNSSIAQTSKLIDEMNSKLSSVKQSNSEYSASTSASAKTTTELGLSMQLYKKIADDVEKIKDKLNALTSDEAKNLAALKLQLSETSKDLINNANATNESYIAKAKDAAAAKDAAENKKNEAIASKDAAAAKKAEEKARQADIAQKKAEAKVTEQLISDYAILKKALQDQAVIYQNLALATGVNSKASKAALSNYAATAGIINDIDKNLSKAGGGAGGFTQQLRGIWSGLLRIAYIMPGLGIAGIFNLAFDAIGNVLEELGLFVDKEKEILRVNTELNKSVVHQIDLYKDLGVMLRKLYDDYMRFESPISSNNNAFLNAKDLEEKSDILSARGLSKDVILPMKLDASKQKLASATESVMDYGKDGGGYLPLSAALSKIRRDLDAVNTEYGSVLGSIGTYSEFVARKGKDIDGFKRYGEEESKLLKAEAESRASLLKQKSEYLEGLLKSYIDANKEYEVSKATLTKFNEDEERMLRTENRRSEISLNLEKNKKILNDNRNFYEEKKAAILSDYNNTVNLNNTNLENITTNNSSTEREKLAAIKKNKDDNSKAELQRDIELDKNEVQFYQRKITAETEIRKDEIEMSAINDERLFLNETYSWKERLNAYESYIVKKQSLKDLEYSLAIQKDASGPGEKTSLTPEEKQRAETHKVTQKFIIQADAENRSYEIVKQSLEKERKLFIEKITQEQDIDRAAYAKELSENNDRFKNKLFKYEAFKKTKEAIDKKYGVIFSFEDEIKKSDTNISIIKSKYDELSSLKAQSDKDLVALKSILDYETEGGKKSLNTERVYNEELGKNKAFNDAIIKAKEDLDSAIEKKDKDAVKAAQAKYEQLIQFEKEHSQNRKQIQEQAFELAKNLANRNVDYELQNIADISKSRNEQYQMSNEAVEKSTLNEKDRIALEIRLAQEKLEQDKKSEKEERKIKHDAAVMERDLTAAQVMWSTIAAVASALKIPPPAGEMLAAERGIIGALQLANIYAVRIPSYKYGTDSTPRGEVARYGEDGAEIVKIPGQEPFVALKETISYLPKGTEIIPIRDSYPVFDKKENDGWEQAKFIAKAISKSNKKEINNIFKPTINVDLGFDSYKRRILGN